MDPLPESLVAIGPFFSAEEARNLEKQLGWTMMEDAGRGWRYIAPSPRPRKILDIDLIESLADQGIAVIAAGRGGRAIIAHLEEALPALQGLTGTQVLAC